MGRVVAGRKVKNRFLGNLTPFSEKFLGIFFFFLFSEIQYRKTKWDSGAFFPVADTQLGTEVSDEARTWTNRLVGGPPPVLFGTAQVGLGHQGGVSVTFSVPSDGWSKSQKSIFGKPYAFFRKISRNFFFFSQKSNTEKPSGIQERFFQLPTHNSGLKYQTRLGPGLIV